MKNLILTIALCLMTAAGAGTVEVTTNPVYEADFTVSADPIKLSQLPKDAQKYLKENYPMPSVKKINRTKGSDGKALYEVTVVVEGKTSVLTFDSKGEFIDPSMTYM